MSDIDYQTLARLNLTYEAHKGVIVVGHKNRCKLWLPHNSQRAFFWYIHGELHQGVTKLLQFLRSKSIFWFDAKRNIEEFLSQ